MTTTEGHTDLAASDATTGQVDMKLEAVVIPVSDVDRAKGGSTTTSGGDQR